jgi:hypothetical protein
VNLPRSSPDVACLDFWLGRRFVSVGQFAGAKRLACFERTLVNAGIRIT